ncbi:DUF2306 domain-containing protein [Pararhodobacter sp.]|uniref:DUF2306 domain-containing protein n=1 Tax=Pararhodobacter sp. TaxID=2127056 RepID=UPI002FE260D4
MLNLSPLLEAAPVVQLHVAAALLALLLGPVALFRRRRDRLHKALGYLWIAAMASAALSSFWLHSIRLIGPFGPIHLLSVLSLGSLVYGLRAAISGNIPAHRKTMQGLYFFGLALPGVFTLWPGRTMNRVLFDMAPMLAVPVMAILILVLVWQGRKRPAQKAARGAAFPLHNPF